MNDIDLAYKNARVISITDESKIVMISDCHRGDGTAADNFQKNSNLYYVALCRYYDDDYSYIELGDGDELWENFCICDVLETYPEIFIKLMEFDKKEHLYMLYGNHDMVKKQDLKYEFYNEQLNCRCRLPFKAIESIILKYNDTELLLLHGHQADYFNNKLWRVGRFLVKHLWKPLELIGVKNPTSASKNNKRKEKIEQKLIDWGKENSKLVVAGHTHLARFSYPNENKYFNDGCCVYSSGISAIEISKGNISLVKWQYKTKKDGTLYVGKTLQKGPVPLNLY